MPPKLSLIPRILCFCSRLSCGRLVSGRPQIEHVTIVSPERVSPMRDALVRVHEGRIVAISKPATRPLTQARPRLRWMAQAYS